VIFNGVVCAAREKCSNLGPLRTVHVVGVDYRAVLLRRPALLLYVGVQMIVPAFSTLLADTPWQERRNE